MYVWKITVKAVKNRNDGLPLYDESEWLIAARSGEQACDYVRRQQERADFKPIEMQTKEVFVHDIRD